MESSCLRETVSFWSRIKSGMNRNPGVCHSCESRNPEVSVRTEIWIPAPCYPGDKFREDDLYARILLLSEDLCRTQVNDEKELNEREHD